jgi:hypothetical protein
MKRFDHLKSSQGAMTLFFACLSVVSAAATTIVPLMMHA